MNKYTLSQMSCLVLFICISPTNSSSSNLDNVEENSTLTIPGGTCQSMEITSRTHLNYTLLRDKCASIDEKKKLKLRTTFDGIETELFEKLPNFENLEAGYLNFTKVYISSSNLKSIDFSNNKLEIFKLLVHGDLEILYLSHNNLRNIEISPASNEKLNVKILDMSYNILSTFDAISNFSDLRYLNLGHNQISYIGDNVLAKLKYLVILNLSFNKLSEFYTCTFCFSQNLEYIDLSHNNLKNVDGLLQSLKNLKYLNLDGNKLLNFDYKLLLQRLPNLETDIINDENKLGQKLSTDNKKIICLHSSNDTKKCRSLKRIHLERRSVPNSHFHVAINNKKLFHNVSSISRKQNMSELVDGSPSIPLKDFFEKLHSLDVDNVRSFLNVTFAKVDSSVANLEHKYGKIMEKLDLVLSHLDSKLDGVNETLNDLVLEISNLDTENGDILNATINEILPNTSFSVADYEDMKFLLSICVFLLLTLVGMGIFRTVMMIRKNRLLKRYRMNLLNLETVP